MKLTLTKDELLVILAHKFGSEITDVSVINPPRPPKELPLFRRLINQLAMELQYPVTITVVCPADKKIAAIKALRGFVPGMGLAEAKWAIENWNRWITFVKGHDREPSFNNLGWGSSNEVTLT
jgi:hypothetical protein